MGIEYLIQFNPFESAEVEKIISRLAPCQENQKDLSFEFKKPDSSKDRPDATVKLMPEGVYFCDHGGHGREFLGRLITVMISHFGAVTIQEFE